jgi:protease I
VKLDGKQVILLIENMFNDLEFWYPYYRLKEAGAAVTVVGSAVDTYTGKAGTQVTAEQGALNRRLSPGGGPAV